MNKFQEMSGITKENWNELVGEIKTGITEDLPKLNSSTAKIIGNVAEHTSEKVNSFIIKHPKLSAVFISMGVGALGGTAMTLDANDLGFQVAAAGIGALAGGVLTGATMGVHALINRNSDPMEVTEVENLSPENSADFDSPEMGE